MERGSSLERLDKLRQEMEIPQSERMSVAYVMAGSIDPNERARALEAIESEWALEEESSAEHAESVDIMQQIELIPEQAREEFVRNLSIIQLTEGCNGKCPFCYLGKKKGVTSKYSYESLKCFFEKYGSRIGTGTPSRQLIPYWDSDPFDYRDGDKSFLDIYKMFKSNSVAGRMGIFTSVPIGGQRDFILFMVDICEQAIDADDYKTFPVTYISVARHNFDRVQASIGYARQTLLGKGYGPEEIDRQIALLFPLAPRTSATIFNAGPQLIDRADPYREITSPACKDGTVMSPKNIKHIFVQSATIYNPSGQREFVLDPEKIEELMPEDINTAYYDPQYTNGSEGFENFRHRIQNRVGEGEIFLKLPRTIHGKTIDVSEMFDDPVEQDVFVLSRLALSFDIFMNNLPQVEKGFSSGHSRLGAYDYLSAAATEFEQLVEQGVERVNNINVLLQGELAEDVRDKLEYYVSLYELRVSQLKYIFKDSKPSSSAFFAARVFTNIGAHQVPRLHEIMENMKQICEVFGDRARELAKHINIQSISSRQPKYEEAYRRVGDECSKMAYGFILEKLGPFWNIEKAEDLPEWMNYFSKSLAALLLQEMQKRAFWR